ncbi:MAG: histidine kinase dimerization/phospho-acceptor domain-containing protein [Gemmatimonadales bacterium]
MAPDPDSPPSSGQTNQPAEPHQADSADQLKTTLAGLAHELNNPLAAIMGFAQLLLKKEWPGEDRAALETINNEAIRSAAIVHNLLVLSGRRVARIGAARPLDVLVVSGNAATRARAESLLSSRGHAVFAAPSPDLALKLAAHTTFDVVVCDEGIVTLGGVPLGSALRETRGCASARFVTTMPRVPGTSEVDSDGLRRLVEAD